MKSFADQVVVIAGPLSARSITVAHALACLGAKVVMAARDLEALADASSALLDMGVRDVVFVVTDPDEQGQMERLAEVALQHNGRIDTWVNDGDLFTVINGSRVALPILAESSGTLVNVDCEPPPDFVPLRGTVRKYTASLAESHGSLPQILLVESSDGATAVAGEIVRVAGATAPVSGNRFVAARNTMRMDHSSAPPAPAASAPARKTTRPYPIAARDGR